MATRDAPKHPPRTSRLAIRIENSLLDDVQIMARTRGMKVQEFITSLILEKRKKIEQALKVLRSSVD